MGKKKNIYLLTQNKKMGHYANRLQQTVRILRVLTLKNQMKPHVTRPHVQLELQLHFPWISPWKRCTLHQHHWYEGCRKKLMPLEKGFLWEGKLKKRVGREPMRIDEKNWEYLIFTLLMTCWLWKLSGKDWNLVYLGNHCIHSTWHSTRNIAGTQ